MTDQRVGKTQREMRQFGWADLEKSRLASAGAEEATEEATEEIKTTEEHTEEHTENVASKVQSA